MKTKTLADKKKTAAALILIFFTHGSESCAYCNTPQPQGAR
jgi:hypothetical protein